MKHFFIATQTGVIKCLPLRAGTAAGDAGRKEYWYFERGNGLDKFYADYMVGIGSELDEGVVFSDYDEAAEKMRVLFLEFIEHFNKHEFNDNPVVVEGGVQSKEHIVALFEECGKWADMAHPYPYPSVAIDQWLQHMGFKSVPAK